MKYTIKSHTYNIGVMMLFFFPLSAILLILFFIFVDFNGKENLPIEVIVALSIALAISAVNSVIFLGWYFIKRVEITDEGIMACNLFKIIDRYLWKEIKYFERKQIDSTRNLQGRPQEFIIFYQDKKYKKEFFGINGKGKPIGIKITDKNITILNNVIKKYNISDKNQELADF